MSEPDWLERFLRKAIEGGDMREAVAITTAIAQYRSRKRYWIQKNWDEWAIPELHKEGER